MSRPDRFQNILGLLDVQGQFPETPSATGDPIEISGYSVVVGSTGLPYEYWMILRQLIAEKHGRLGQLTDAIHDLRNKMAEITDLLANAGLTDIPSQNAGSSQVMRQVLTSLGNLPSDITVPDRVAVGVYLVEHPDIIELILPVCEIARKHVGTEAQLVLGVYSDPDGGDGHLSLYIRLEHYSTNIFEIISHIEAEYIDKLAGKSGWIIVTTDFCDME